MNRILISCLALATWPIFTQAQTASHCKDGEADFLSCELKKSRKVLSICGSSNVISSSGKDGWLQYRFGRINQIELAYPESKELSLGKFEANYLTPIDDNGVRQGILNFSFDIGTVNYNVTSQTGKPPFTGVEISNNGKLVRYRCATVKSITWTPGEPDPPSFYGLVLSLQK